MTPVECPPDGGARVCAGRSSVGDASSPGDGDSRSLIFADAFERSVATGLGSPEHGEGSYVCDPVDGSLSEVTGGRAVIRTGGGQSQCVLIDAAAGDLEAAADVYGTAGNAHVMIRVSGTYTYYEATLALGASPALTVAEVNPGTWQSLASGPSGFDTAPGEPYRMRFRATGPPTATTLELKAWPLAEAEPSAYQVRVVDADGLTGRGAGLGAWSLSSVTVAFDNFVVVSIP